MSVVNAKGESSSKWFDCLQMFCNLEKAALLIIIIAVLKRKDKVEGQICILPAKFIRKIKSNLWSLEVVTMFLLESSNASDPKIEVILDGIECNEGGNITKKDVDLFWLIHLINGLEGYKDQIHIFMSEIPFELSHFLADETIQPQKFLLLFDLIEYPGCHEEIDIAKAKQVDML